MYFVSVCVVFLPPYWLSEAFFIHFILLHSIRSFGNYNIVIIWCCIHTMVLRDAMWCCVVLRGAAWCCVTLRDAAWCCVGSVRGSDSISYLKRGCMGIVCHMLLHAAWLLRAVAWMLRVLAWVLRVLCCSPDARSQQQYWTWQTRGISFLLLPPSSLTPPPLTSPHLTSPYLHCLAFLVHIVCWSYKRTNN